MLIAARSERGQSLPLAMAFLAVFAVVAVAVLRLASSEQGTVASDGLDARRSTSVMAGVDAAMGALNSGHECQGASLQPFSITVSVPAGDGGTTTETVTGTFSALLVGGGCVAPPPPGAASSSSGAGARGSAPSDLPSSGTVLVDGPYQAAVTACAGGGKFVGTVTLYVQGGNARVVRYGVTTFGPC